MKDSIYLDYNATAPIRASVISAVTEAMSVVGNPSSVHAAGRKARTLIEEARAKVAALVHARARDIVFTSGGTEANNAVLRASGAKSLIVSAVEHDCVLAGAKASGLPVRILPVSSNGVVDLEVLRDLLEEDADGVLVSVMLANNETGVLQPLETISALVKTYDARLHCDAVQAVGKVAIDFQDLGVDYMTLSAHKVGGPQGVGAIILSPTAPLKAFIAGGGQELGRRSGTENIAGIAGFGEAAIEALSSLSDATKLCAIRDHIEREILDFADDAVIAGRDAARVSNTSCIIMPGVKGETQVMHFDLGGIAVSSGSACSSGKVKVSHVLSAMGYPDDLANCSLRMSLGYQSTEGDAERFVDAWKTLYRRVRR